MASVERVDTKWFQGKLLDKGISQRKLAARLGLDPAAVSLMFRGRRKMTVVEAKEIARALGVAVQEVLAHFGGNVVAGPGAFAAPARESSAALGNGGMTMGGHRSGDADSWEREFMQRWTDLGMMLLRRPR